MNKVFGTLAFAILIAATWLTLTHHAITDKINTWQAGMMGDNKFFPALTIFILALPPLLLLLVIKKRIIKKEKNIKPLPLPNHNHTPW